MKKLLALALVVAFATPAFAAGNAPGFLDNLKDAKAQAKKENKLIFLHFTTDWCGWCRVIEKNIYSNKEGKEALKNFVKASLNCTKKKPNAAEYNKLMRELGGGGYPFLAILAPDGTPLKTQSGAAAMPAFKAMLKSAEANFETYKALKALEAKDPNSAEFLAKKLEFSVGVPNWADAKATIAKIEKVDPEFKTVNEAVVRYAQYMIGANTRGTKDMPQRIEAVVKADKVGNYRRKVYSLELSRAMRAAAYIMQRMRKPQLAKKYYEKGIKYANLLLEDKGYKGNKLNLHMHLADAYIGTQNFEEAKKQLDKVAGMNPTGRMLINLNLKFANYYAMQKDFENAIKYVDKVLAGNLNPRMKAGLEKFKAGLEKAKEQQELEDAGE